MAWSSSSSQMARGVIIATAILALAYSMKSLLLFCSFAGYPALRGKPLPCCIGFDRSSFQGKGYFRTIAGDVTIGGSNACFGCHFRSRPPALPVPCALTSDKRSAVTKALVEEKGVKLVNDNNWNGNGCAPGLEVLERSEIESLDAYLKDNGVGNGSLVKYAGGNGRQFGKWTVKWRRRRGGRGWRRSAKRTYGSKNRRKIRSKI
ncbi:hypothetical protein HPP92_016465 [Vanilla planifolia]|uniref:Cytochrome c domain-containing protein n=1 Tax=Vanilla planifolia TaxID=51239 RepID=A0A835URA6_VANPL|nr:hypothetical protein HPP92_016465 [Vanilla planifolia]